jgi:hypothetical protein
VPKNGSLWTKSYEQDGQTKIKYQGTIELDGIKFYMDLYPKSSDNPKAPKFDVYLKPVQKLQDEPSMEMDDIAF